MGDEISIKVKTLDGQSRDVKVSKNATVMDLKARIEQLTKMPKNRQRIIYQGNERILFFYPSSNFRSCITRQYETRF